MALAEMVMGRFGYRPIWLWAEMTSDQTDVQVNNVFLSNVCTAVDCTGILGFLRCYRWFYQI